MTKLVVEVTQFRHPKDVKHPKAALRIRQSYPESMWGKWKWQIGSHENMGGLGCFFVEEESVKQGHKFKYDPADKRSACYRNWQQRKGTLYATRQEAQDAAFAALPEVEKRVAAEKAKYKK